MAEAVAARGEDSATGVASGALVAESEIVVLPVADGAHGERPQPLVKDAKLTFTIMNLALAHRADL